MDYKQNGYISYLNSLHNVSASGANALAESQALSPYFGPIYQPFPLIPKLIDALTDNVPRVVVLTGHAGDGKSTIALDVLKQLRQLPPEKPLETPLNERENIDNSNGLISIIKDMSELSIDQRQEWLTQAFSDSGSWLIVSNTGPLLQSFDRFAGKDNIESEMLKMLDKPLDGSPLDDHSVDFFCKKLILINLTRMDNVDLGSEILVKLVNHPAWGECKGCPAETACPLQLNRKAIRDAGAVAKERVGWIYQRLNAYEQRLTLRQIVAQLAFGLTGGMTCNEAYQQVAGINEDAPKRGSEALAQILFSEGFFGYRRGKSCPKSENLHAVQLVRRITFGGPMEVDFERKLLSEVGAGWAELSTSLRILNENWRQRANEPTGVRWRFALRRMTYLFGEATSGKEQIADLFLDNFLQSPSLRQFKSWQAVGEITLTRVQINQLRKTCLRVILEVFSGFSASQFPREETLYLTLRRPDRAVIQPTQLVIETIPFKDFELNFDPERKLPVLKLIKGSAKLGLTLPLMDYIRNSDLGELGNSLSPIHQAQLDLFRAELVKATMSIDHREDEIELLRAGIDGEVSVHRYLLDQDNSFLEQNI